MDAPQTRRSRTLGVVAFVAAFAALVLGGIALFLAGRGFGAIAEYVDLLELSRTGTEMDPDTLPAAALAIADAAVWQRAVGMAVWAAFALWAVVQGIIAIIQRRGRSWAIAAVLLAPLSYFVIQMAYTAGVALGAVPFIDAAL